MLQRKRLAEKGGCAGIVYWILSIKKKREKMNLIRDGLMARECLELEQASEFLDLQLIPWLPLFLDDCAFIQLANDTKQM
jgi:hypothetical protein